MLVLTLATFVLKHRRIHDSFVRICIICMCSPLNRAIYSQLQSREWVDGSWVMGQMGHENRMGHMGHGSLGVDP